MIIEGLQKLTLLDYPGKAACTVFLHGCNYRCPFCHNASLVTRRNETSLSLNELGAFFEKRKHILDGVCVTGGEALLDKDIAQLLAFCKSFGFSVKLDTNGSFPDKLEALISEGLVDYVAMDIKSSPERYALACGVKDYDVTPVMKSVELLMNGKTEYEFRTTVVRELHTNEDLISIGKWITGARAYFLQQFTDSGDLISGGLSAYSKDEMHALAQAVRVYVPAVAVRGV